MANIIIERQRFAQALVELINGAALPAFAKLDVLDRCQRELTTLTRQEYEQALEAEKEEQAEEPAGED